VWVLLLHPHCARHGSLGLRIPALGFALELGPTVLLLHCGEPPRAPQRLERHLDGLSERFELGLAHARGSVHSLST
jgi:hypothetical protein